MAYTGTELIWVVVCYMMGCVTTGYYWARWRAGIDLRKRGSGNLGARNAGRVLGRTGFTIALLGDTAKGMVAVGVARALAMDPYITIAAMLAVALGHVWPYQLKFQGGKGVAVSLGALLVYNPYFPLILLGTVIPAYLLIRRFTLAGMLAYTLAPLVVFLVGFDAGATFAMSAISMLVLVAHRENIRAELTRFWGSRDGKAVTNHPPEKGAS
jgi:glycerol-3-phosphate acyltransferase PlsY